MRRFIMMMAIVVLTTCIWAQTEIEENTAQDSLKIENVIIDTLEERIDPKLLLDEMNNFLDEKKKSEDDFFLPHLIYQENFHLSSPFNLNMRITKNGFSEIPFATENLQTVQNNRNIFKTIYKRGNIFYNSWEYSLPAALTETYMGLGDNNMNNIAVSLMKGSIFGIPKLDMQLDYLGEKGIWQGYEDEVIQNFHLHLIYNLNFARIHFDNNIIDQSLPSGKDIYENLGYMYPNFSASNKENVYSIKIENNIVDIGLKYKYNNYKIENFFRKERNLTQVLVKKKFAMQNHQLDLSYEFISEDIVINSYSNSIINDRSNSYHIFSADQDSNIFGFNIGNTGFFRDNNNYKLDSNLKKKIFHGFSLCGELNASSTEFYPNVNSNNLLNQIRSGIGGGLSLDLSHIRTKIIMGQHQYEDFIGNYFDMHSKLFLNFTKNINIKLDQWLRNEQTNFRTELNTEIISFPEWQMSNLLEIKYLLKYNNAIKLGLRHIYHSNYSYYLDGCESPFTSHTQNFDAYLKIQLTNNFEISVDAVNLTNNKIMFTNYNHPGTHFNFNVHWIFMN